jgi:hypothetical protein
MAFADLKNDFVFRRIFTTHPDILRGLLNDLLDRTGDRAIVSIEYLPSEQLPLVVGAKLSIRGGLRWTPRSARVSSRARTPRSSLGGSSAPSSQHRLRMSLLQTTMSTSQPERSGAA